MRWFQVDSDTPDDPKLQALIRHGLAEGGNARAAELLGHLFLLWCYTANHGAGQPGFAVREDGSPLPRQEMADYCLMTVEELVELVYFLASRGHVHGPTWEATGVVWFPGMTKRADAYARSKGRKRAAAGEAGGIFAQVSPDQPLPTTPDPTTTDQTLLPPGEPDQVDALVALWNDTRQPGPKVRDITPERRRKYQRALKAAPNLVDWKAVILWANGQGWCNAKGNGEHRSWRMDLDFLTRPGKLAEYLDKARADQRPAGGPAGRDVGRGRLGFTPGEFAAATKDDSGQG